METIKDTLVVNDKLSVEYEYINKNGEKYVLYDKGKLYKLSDIKIPVEHQYKYETRPYNYSAGIFYVMEYINYLSRQINGEACFDNLYSYEIDELTTWNLWNDIEINNLVNKWRNRYQTHELSWNDVIRTGETIYESETVVDKECLVANTKNLLFPFEINIDQKRYLHFDIFIFLLYLEHHEYKNDLIRFLKYQPVCTKTTDELFIFNLKQTNKDLLKQLNEANDMISQIKKEFEHRLESTISETKTKLTSDYDSKLNQVNKTHESEIQSLKEKYDKEIEKLMTELNAVKTMRDQLMTENESLKQDIKTMTCYVDTYKNKFEALNDKVIKAKNMLE